MAQGYDAPGPPVRPAGSSGMLGEAPSSQNTLFRFSWVYLEGLIVIMLIVFLAETIAKGAAEISSWLRSVFGGGEATGWPGVIVVVLVLAAPWIVGRLTDSLLRHFQKDRSVQALIRWERHLIRELAPDQARGYGVALLKWPSKEVRTLVVVGATFLDPETGQRLAPVYLPNTPDITRGKIRVVSSDQLSLTDWKLRDLINCHISLGSAIPPTPPDGNVSDG